MHSEKNGSMNTIYFFVGSSNFQEYEIYQVEYHIKEIFISKKDLQNILDCPAKLLDKDSYFDTFLKLPSYILDNFNFQNFLM